MSTPVTWCPRGEAPGDRDAAAAADVQDVAVMGEAVAQIGKPRSYSGAVASSAR